MLDQTDRISEVAAIAREHGYHSTAEALVRLQRRLVETGSVIQAPSLDVSETRQKITDLVAQ